MSPFSEPWTPMCGAGSKGRERYSLGVVRSEWREGQGSLFPFTGPGALQTDQKSSAIIQGLQLFGTCCQETGRKARVSLGRGISFQPRKAVKCKPKALTGGLEIFPFQFTEAKWGHRAGPC